LKVFFIFYYFSQTSSWISLDAYDLFHNLKEIKNLSN